jgi:flagella basal body P-ring formation protein FlgA
VRRLLGIGLAAVALFCLPGLVRGDALEPRVLERVEQSLGPGPWVLRLQPSELPGEVIELRAPAGGIRPGRNFFQVALRDGPRTVQRVLTVDVLRADSVWVTRMALPPGHILRPGDLSRTLRAHPHAEADVAMGDPVGLRLRVGLPSGAVLTRSMVERPPMVRRGDRVRLVYRSQGLLVTALAEAREEGSPGDVIRVRVLGARKECRARLREDGSLEVIVP